MRGFASLFGRRGVLAAAFAASTVLVVSVVLQLLSTAVSWIFISSQQSGVFSFSDAAPVVGLVLGALPFAVGVFISLWLLAPIGAELHIAHVITRSLLAVAAGIVVVFLVLFSGALFAQMSASDGLVFGWLVAAFRAVGRNVGSAAGWALYSSVTQGIALIPLTVLTGVLLWLWLHKHPHKHAVSGLIDEV